MRPTSARPNSVSPSVTANRPTALAAAPGRSSRRDPGLRAGRTATAVIATAMTANGMLTQKTEAQPEKRSRIPPTAGPTPKPVPPTAAQVPMAPARVSGGNASVMMDSVSASIAAPPTPWSARKATRAIASGDRAQAAEPIAKITTPTRKIRRRP